MNACPDCLADQRLVELEPNMYVLQILHDNTCPAFLAKAHK